MRGYLKKRPKDSWTIVITVGRKVDPKTGKSRPDQKWFTVKGTKKEAEAKLAELIHQYNRGELVEPTKMTVGEWLTRWLDAYVMNSSKKKLRTQETYHSIVKNHLIPALGHIHLQKLQPADIQAYYNNSNLSPSTLEQHHAVLHQALKVAMQNERLLNTNPATMVAEKPRGKENLDMQVWSVEEVRRFLSEARKRGTQCEAFYSTALETGMRKGELCGLKWEDVDLENRLISVRRTLIKAGPDPVMGTPKTGRGRAIAISPGLAKLLARHKAEQNEQRLRLGSLYHNHGFVFAKQTGEPLQMNNFGQREFTRLIEASGVKKIRFHDLRHTCATLLLAHGMHPKIVQERLGHSNISMTLDRYSHVTPTMQENAAQVMGDILHTR